MRRLLGIATTLVVALGVLSCRSEQPNDITVISYNIRLASTRDGDNVWDNRKHASLNMIREEQPTIFGLQEALPAQMQYLIDNLPEYGHIGVGREDGAAKGEHMAIFYLKDKVELLDGGTFWLSPTPDTPSKGWDAACKRTCTWARLRMKHTGKVFAYLNSHLDHIGAEARAEGLALIAKRVEEIMPKGTVFLTADFNATTSNPAFEPLKAIMKDARTEAEDTDYRATLNLWSTEHCSNPDFVIDHIFYRDAEAQSFGVLCDKNYGAPFISDHYPVMMKATF